MNVTLSSTATANAVIVNCNNDLLYCINRNDNDNHIVVGIVGLLFLVIMLSGSWIIFITKYKNTAIYDSTTLF